jgi:hypothetical protein
LPIIRNPQISVEEIFAEPELGYVTTTGKVPTLAITVAYEAIINGQERKLPPIGYGFRERIVVQGTMAQLSFDFLPVTKDQEDLSLLREKTVLVEKKLITDDLGVLGSIPIQCAISIAIEPDPRRTEYTNTVNVPGAQFRSTAAVVRIADAVFWLRDQLIGRWSPEP